MPTFWRVRRCREDFCERRLGVAQTVGKPTVSAAGGEAVDPAGEQAHEQEVTAKALKAVVASVSDASCETWCQHPCNELNGESIREECGGCDERSACRPGANSYPG